MSSPTRGPYLRTDHPFATYITRASSCINLATDATGINSAPSVMSEGRATRPGRRNAEEGYISSPTFHAQERRNLQEGRVDSSPGPIPGYMVPTGRGHNAPTTPAKGVGKGHGFYRGMLQSKSVTNLGATERTFQTNIPGTGAQNNLAGISIAENIGQAPMPSGISIHPVTLGNISNTNLHSECASNRDAQVPHSHGHSPGPILAVNNQPPPVTPIRRAPLSGFNTPASTTKRERRRPIYLTPENIGWLHSTVSLHGQADLVSPNQSPSPTPSRSRPRALNEAGTMGGMGMGCMNGTLGVAESRRAMSHSPVGYTIDTFTNRTLDFELGVVRTPNRSYSGNSIESADSSDRSRTLTFVSGTTADISTTATSPTVAPSPSPASKTTPRAFPKSSPKSKMSKQTTPTTPKSKIKPSLSSPFQFMSAKARKARKTTKLCKALKHWSTLTADSVLDSSSADNQTAYSSSSRDSSPTQKANTLTPGSGSSNDGASSSPGQNRASPLEMDMGRFCLPLRMRHKRREECQCDGDRAECGCEGEGEGGARLASRNEPNERNGKSTSASTPDSDHKYSTSQSFHKHDLFFTPGRASHPRLMMHSPSPPVRNREDEIDWTTVPDKARRVLRGGYI